MLCSQLLGLRSEAQAQLLTSLRVPSASTRPFMLARPESKVGRKGISPNRTNKRQLGFKSLLDNVKKLSQMFLEKVLDEFVQPFVSLCSHSPTSSPHTWIQVFRCSFQQNG